MVFHVIIQPQRFNLVFDLMRYSYNKAIQYSYTYKPRLNVCLVGNRLTWMGVILSSYICFFFLAAKYTRARAPKLLGQLLRFLKLNKYIDLFYWQQVLCNFLNEFSCCLDSFLISGGGSSWVQSRKINTNSNLVKNRIHATVRRQ